MRTRCLQAHKTPPHKWTPEDDEFIRTYAPGHLINEIQEEYERRFNASAPTASAIQNRKTQLGVKSGIRGGCFEKGMTPWNKGKSWDELGIPEESRRRCTKTQFKAGQRPHNAMDKPIGYERVDSKDGYVYVKVKDEQQLKANENFRMKHHLVWEKANGRPVPRDCNIVFADRNKQNFDPENLVAVPRSLWSIISHENIAYADRETLEAAMDIAKARHAIYSAKCRPRECKACGETFTPRYPHQRTCDLCLSDSRITA